MSAYKNSINDPAKRKSYEDNYDKIDWGNKKEVNATNLSNTAKNIINKALHNK